MASGIRWPPAGTECCVSAGVHATSVLKGLAGGRGISRMPRSDYWMMCAGLSSASSARRLISGSWWLEGARCGGIAAWSIAEALDASR